MASILRDLRYAFRLFAKSPGPYAVAVLSLALAIGPNTFLFSVLSAVFLRPWPVDDPDGLHSVYFKTERVYQSFSYPDYLDYRDRNKAFSGLAAWSNGGALMTSGGQRKMLNLSPVTSNYFSVLGVRPALGRMLESASDQGDLPLVISYGLWQREFGRSRSVIGARVLLDDRYCSVVGVAPRDFAGLKWIIPTDVWVPMEAWPQFRGRLAQRGKRGLDVIGRLRPGVSMQQAEGELGALAGQLAAAYPDTNRGMQPVLENEGESRTKRGAVFSTGILALTGLVLLIACANVAGLLVAQAEARRRETVIRLAVGADRARLVRQLLTESLLLSLMGAAVGCLFAYWMTALIPSLLPPIPLPLNWDIRIDGAVLVYTLIISVVTAVVFGLVPALQASRMALTPVLTGGRRFTLRGGLVVAQIAVSAFLLAGAGVLLRSYLNVREIRPGFDIDKPMLVVWAGSREKVDFEQVAQRLEALPGVKRVSFSKYIPLSGSGVVSAKVSLPGRPPETQVRYNLVGPNYFQTMGTRLLRGRAFGRGESGQSAIINMTMSRRFWPNQDSIGKWFEADGKSRQVVGVVEDGKYDSLRERPQPFLFLPYSQGGGEAAYFIETAVEPGSLAAAARGEASAAGLIVLQTVSLQGQMRLSRYFDEMGTGMAGGAGLLAVFLAAVGLFGVVASVMGRRRREFGIRMALGATRADIMKIVYSHGLKLALIGLPMGLAAAYLGTLALRSVLYGVEPGDPLTFLCGSALIILIALAACHFPAMRATQVEPASTLRSE